jgi:hypothetical protein
MHLGPSGSWDYTVSIADTVSAIFADEFRGADTTGHCLMIAWDDQGGCLYTYCDGLAACDPFQNGDRATMPAWYVVRELDRRYGWPCPYLG